MTKLVEVLRWEVGAENEFQDKLSEWESVIEDGKVNPKKEFSTPLSQRCAQNVH